MSANILLIDNLDSFTFNLVDAIQRLGANVRVLRTTVSAGAALAAAEESEAGILISPGPGRPEDSGCILELVKLAKGRVPLAGVCLGQQAILMEAGAPLERAVEPLHRKGHPPDHDRE